MLHLLVKFGYFFNNFLLDVVQYYNFATFGTCRSDLSLMI